jgi:histidinol phosphatase-like PHP family hydrolase
VVLVLSSDVHVPEEVGFGFSDLVAAARAAGVQEVMVFRGPRREPIVL